MVVCLWQILSRGLFISALLLLLSQAIHVTRFVYRLAVTVRFGLFEIDGQKTLDAVDYIGKGSV